MEYTAASVAQFQDATAQTVSVLSVWARCLSLLQIPTSIQYTQMMTELMGHATHTVLFDHSLV
jgi:hypothetical protein